MQQQAVFIERNSCINCSSANLQELSRGRYMEEPLHGFLAADPWGTDPLQFLQTAEWSLVKCTGCSQVFHRRVLNAEWNERRFSEWMSADAIQEFELRNNSRGPFGRATQHTTHVLRLEKLTRAIRNGQPVRLLDFGCGWGEFLASCQIFGFDVVGVDRSTARRANAVVRIEPSLDATAGPFHAVTLFETLEHLDQPAEILKAINPLLVTGGILVLETPDCSGVTAIKTHKDYRLIHPLEHINAFTHGTLKSIAKRCGFQSISRPSVHVTSDLNRVARTIVKALIGKGEHSTQLYFEKI